MRVLGLGVRGEGPMFRCARCDQVRCIYHNTGWPRMHSPISNIRSMFYDVQNLTILVSIVTSTIKFHYYFISKLNFYMPR